MNWQTSRREPTALPPLLTGYVEAPSKSPNVVFYEGRRIVFPRWMFGAVFGAGAMVLIYVGYQVSHTESSQVVGQVTSNTAELNRIPFQFEATERARIAMAEEFKAQLAARDKVIAELSNRMAALESGQQELKKKVDVAPIVCTTPKQNGGVRFVPC